MGFPSADSDYDVRFVYRCLMDEYLSVADRRDVIETPTVHDEVLAVELDLNGWDIRKALQLALKSNAALLEWLNSPVLLRSSVGTRPCWIGKNQTALIEVCFGANRAE